MPLLTPIEFGLPEECANGSELALSDGRTLAVIRSEAGEEIQLQSPDGAIEVRIVVTANGPVVRMKAVRLEVDTSADVNFSCRRFAVHTTESTNLTTNGQLRLRSQEQVLIRAREELDLKGRPVRTNVKDGLFYGDYIKPVNGPNWGTAFEGVPRPDLP